MDILIWWNVHTTLGLHFTRFPKPLNCSLGTESSMMHKFPLSLQHLVTNLIVQWASIGMILFSKNTKFWQLDHFIFKQDLGIQNRILETSSFLLCNEMRAFFLRRDGKGIQCFQSHDINIYFNCNMSNMGQEGWHIRKWHLIGVFFQYMDTF